MSNQGSGHPELVSGSLKMLKQVQHDQRFLFVIVLFFISFLSFSEKKEVWLIDSTGTVLEKQIIETNVLQQADDAPNPLFKLFRKKQTYLFGRREDNRRITAALLAFPFPFGIVGLHRIFLGTKPYVPVAYIASLGGIFGLMPLIDFFVICFDKDFEQYLNNPKVLMWVK
jgi:TM2 domain-containing membrane protein YozV